MCNVVGAGEQGPFGGSLLVARWIERTLRIECYRAEPAIQETGMDGARDEMGPIITFLA